MSAFVPPILPAVGSVQSRFAHAVVQAAGPAPDGLTAWHGQPPVGRFAVYRNNVQAGLARALASRFPAGERIVGPDFFAAMARAYVERQPPRSPVLLGYGDNFPDFVAAFEPAASVPYLADVLRIEVARSRAYHAADLSPLDPVELAAVPPEAVGALRFRLHPAVHLVRSPHPAVTIWTMNAEGGEPGPIADWRGEDALVVRPHLAVAVHRLPPGGADFIAALGGGATLAEAAEASADASDGFDLAAHLTGALSSGVFAAIG